MEISSVQQHEAMASQHLDEPLSCQQQEQKKPRPQPEQALKCPRCDSTNTKFCYYNNYSLSQPRYFCKGCRRYWTKGGSLRNVPVGGGCRKIHKRPSSSSPSPNPSSSSCKLINNNNNSNRSQQQQQEHNEAGLPPALPLPPLSLFDPNDLTLAFTNDAAAVATSFMLGNPNPNPNPNPNHVSGFLDILRNPTGPSFQNGMYYGGGSEELDMFPSYNGGFINMNMATTMAAATTTGTMSTAVTSSAADASVGGGGGGCKGLMMMDDADVGGEDNKMVMGVAQQQQQQHWGLMQGEGDGNGLHHHHHHQYWVNNGGGGSWHGLVNSSLM